jgi:hypothetical protein
MKKEVMGRQGRGVRVKDEKVNPLYSRVEMGTSCGVVDRG